VPRGGVVRPHALDVDAAAHGRERARTQPAAYLVGGVARRLQLTGAVQLLSHAASVRGRRRKR
jgi:hypothetical protein